MTYAVFAVYSGGGFSRAEKVLIAGFAVLPWTFKFLWAPMIDSVRWPSMGLRRPWIAIAQLGKEVAPAVRNRFGVARIRGLHLFDPDRAAAIKKGSLKHRAVCCAPLARNRGTVICHGLYRPVVSLDGPAGSCLRPRLAAMRTLSVRGYPFKTSTMVSPRRAGLGDTLMPADSIASILDGASPLPPETMAPAWPMVRPGGAVRPAMKPTIGFLRPFLASSFRNGH